MWCTSTHVEVREQPEGVSSFHLQHSGIELGSFIRLDGSCLYPLNHLVSTRPSSPTPPPTVDIPATVHMQRSEDSLACGSSPSTLFETEMNTVCCCVANTWPYMELVKAFLSPLTLLWECWDYTPHHCTQFHRDSRDLNSGHGACVTNTWSTVQSPQSHVSFLTLLICYLWNEQLTISCYNLTTKWSHGCSRVCSPESCICLKDKISICLIVIILVGVSNSHFKTMGTSYWSIWTPKIGCLLMRYVDMVLLYCP